MELSSPEETVSAGAAAVLHQAPRTGALPRLGASGLPGGTGIASCDQPNPSALPVQTHSPPTADADRVGFWVITAGLVGLFLKLSIAFNTFGTNDVVTFYSFARS